jgi:oxygen-dependent protoporphyrinogen oxidase
VSAVSWVSSKWNGRAPADHVLLRAYLGGARDPEAIDLDDERIRTRVQADFARLLGIRAEPVVARIYRWPHASPQLDVGHPYLMDEIDRHVARWPGLSVSAAGFRGAGIADCVGDARAQAAWAAQSDAVLTTA